MIERYIDTSDKCNINYWMNYYMNIKVILSYNFYNICRICVCTQLKFTIQ